MLLLLRIVSQPCHQRLCQRVTITPHLLAMAALLAAAAALLSGSAGAAAQASDTPCDKTSDEGALCCADSPYNMGRYTSARSWVSCCVQGVAVTREACAKFDGYGYSQYTTPQGVVLAQCCRRPPILKDAHHTNPHKLPPVLPICSQGINAHRSSCKVHDICGICPETLSEGETISFHCVVEDESLRNNEESSCPEGWRINGNRPQCIRSVGIGGRVDLVKVTGNNSTLSGCRYEAKAGDGRAESSSTTSDDQDDYTGATTSDGQDDYIGVILGSLVGGFVLGAGIMAICCACCDCCSYCRRTKKAKTTRTDDGAPQGHSGAASPAFANPAYASGDEYLQIAPSGLSPPELPSYSQATKA